MSKGPRSKYSVGFKKPPRQTQFKPGQSGNPSGRPKKRAMSFAESFEKELNTFIFGTIGGKRRRFTKQDAIVKHQIKKAIDGDQRSTEFVLRVLESRSVEQAEQLSPILNEMRAINAMHKAAREAASRGLGDSETIDDSVNDNADKA